MSDLDLMDSLIGALNGPRPWAALEYLPRIASFAEKEPSGWPTANLVQCVIGLICTQALIHKLEDDELPMDLAGPDRSLLVQSGYSAATTSCLIATRRLQESVLQISTLLPRHYISQGELYADAGTIPAFAELAAAHDDLARWVDTDVFDLLMSSDTHWRRKLEALQSATVAQIILLSWYFIRIAVERWPSSLEGELSWEVFLRICVSAQHLMAHPNFLATTEHRVWTKLSQVAEIVVKTYPAAIRTKLTKANPLSGKEFVAVIDPLTALSNAGLSLIGPWLETVSEHSDGTAFEEARKKYKHVRGFGEEKWGARSAPDSLQHYTDFVSYVEGDGSWPATIPDVEYIVREIIVAGGIEGAVKAPQELYAPTPRGWVWLRTPWSLPLVLGDNPHAADMHRRSPLLAWMIHSSTNPFLSQNLFSNMDLAVAYMQETIGAVDKKQKFNKAMLDAESITVPAAVALSTSGLIPFLFPEVPTYAVAPLAAMVYPIVKVVRSRIK